MENSIESLNLFTPLEFKTLYVSRPVALADAEKIARWARSQGLKNVIDPLDIHVTIAFSSKELDWNQLQLDPAAINVEASELSVTTLGEDGAVVLQVNSKQLCDRWQQFQDNGASWGFQSLTPHITITDNGGKVDLASIAAYPDLIGLRGEEWDTLRLDSAADSADEISQPSDPTLQDLFVAAKELKNIIQLKIGMINIIDRDMAALVRRKEQENNFLQEARNNLALVKEQLNEKINKEDWNDMVLNKTDIVVAGKKAFDSTKSWLQVFGKNLKSLTGR